MACAPGVLLEGAAAPGSGRALRAPRGVARSWYCFSRTPCSVQSFFRVAALASAPLAAAWALLNCADKASLLCTPQRGQHMHRAQWVVPGWASLHGLHERLDLWASLASMPPQQAMWLPHTCVARCSACSPLIKQALPLLVAYPDFGPQFRQVALQRTARQLSMPTHRSHMGGMHACWLLMGSHDMASNQHVCRG